MGRSGGGGGSHSSGGFSGGHSSGGFSGGGRSSVGGFSSRPSYGGGGFHGYNPPPRGPRPMHHHHIWFGGPFYREPYYGVRTGFSSAVMWLIIIIIFFVIILTANSAGNNETNIPNNTKQRTALSGVVNKTDWYEDKIGWISNKNTLISGLEDFYNKTGVQPYVMLIPYSAEYWNGTSLNVNSATNYLEDVYKNKFSDEGHFIFAYFECQNDTKSEMDGEFRYLAGYSADTITIPHSDLQTVKYQYDEKNKVYKRFARNKAQTDWTTGDNLTTKNIIVTMCDNYNLNDGENKGRQTLKNIGTFDGYYLTNGKAIKIKCVKNARDEQTVYQDLQGNEIKVNDGNTWVNICPKDAKIVIEGTEETQSTAQNNV